VGLDSAELVRAGTVIGRGDGRRWRRLRTRRYDQRPQRSREYRL